MLLIIAGHFKLARIEVKKSFRTDLANLLLLLIIPAITLGFSSLENTGIYQRFIKTDAVISAVEHKLLGLNFQSDVQHLVYPTDPEFHNLWRVIKNNTVQELPKNVNPQYFAIFGPHAHDYVELPRNGELQTIYLIPNSVPVVAGFCNPEDLSSCQLEKNAFIIGTAQDIKDWVYFEKEKARARFDRWIAVISFILGILVVIRKKVSYYS
jgi:hypothetical protein